MALLLEELEWGKPLVPASRDPAWEAELIAMIGVVPECCKLVASSGWVRRTYLDCMRVPMPSLSSAEAELAGFLTSQENACRYCYGVARARMKMIGFTDEMVDRIERSAQLVEADPKERTLVGFCRALARSKPRPSRKAREELHAAGYSSQQTAELACVVAVVGFCNRLSTLLAAPVEFELEARGKKMQGLWNKLTAWLPSKQTGAQLPAPNYPPPKLEGPLSDVLRSLEGAPAAGMLEIAVNGAFSSDVLPRRSVALMTAVIARALQCDTCEAGAAMLLEADGFSRASLDEVLTTLSSPQLTDVEARLIPWARDTVWMPEQPARIQERTRPLVDALGPQVVIEAVGAAALANGMVRLAMLQK